MKFKRSIFEAHEGTTYDNNIHGRYTKGVAIPVQDKIKTKQKEKK